MDTYHKLSHIINTCIIQSDFKEVNFYSADDIMIQIQRFIGTLDQVSYNLDEIIHLEYNSGNFDTDPIDQAEMETLDAIEDIDGYRQKEVDELQNISQLMLIAKIRQRCS